RQDPLEMRAERLFRNGRLLTVDCRLRNPCRPSPFVEHVEHVRLAEIDLHRPPPRTLRVVALEVPIDPFERDLERHTLRRPAGDQIERRTRDANQMPVVLPAEIGFNFPTKI